MRHCISEYLGTAFHVIESNDGDEGIQTAFETTPDLIISDVSMPKKDGMEVCRILKSDERTSHIPVILLTAKTETESKIAGLERGADDYVTKPFHPQELLVRVTNLIDLRKRLRERFKAGEILRPGDVVVESIDNQFLQRVKVAVEYHIGEEGFSAEDLSHEVGMSRSQVHRKLTSLTNLSTREFIRYIRLQRAKELLENNAATISEIAYQVGFGSVAYFTKCFREQFGRLPSEVRSSKLP